MTEFKQFKVNAVEMANAHVEAMDGMNEYEAMTYVRGIVADNNVVVAVWQDTAELDGVGLLGVKGSNTLGEIAVSGIAASLKFSAVPCRDCEQAAALQQVLGDKPNA